MTEKISGIVLNIRKYNDSNNIVTLYTRSHGRLSFISPVGKGKTGQVRRALLQPLAVISTEFNYKATAELQRLGSISTLELWSHIYYHPVKRIMAMFISEFLYRLLNATMPDELLFDFLIDSLRIFDRLDSGIPDFHIALLVGLLSYSGIQPDVTGYESGKIFDFGSGGYVDPREFKGAGISGEEAGYVKMVARLNFVNIKRLRLTNANRRQILYGLLNYYSFHFPGLGALKSPEVLREIFE